MPIVHLESTSELDKILDASSDKLSVIDFHATWCGPCHQIAPIFETLSKQYDNVNFLKCDVDAAQEVAARYAISAMPTFVFLKGSTKVDEVRGANTAALQDAVKTHSSGSAGTGAFAGKGQTLGGVSTGTPGTGSIDSLINLNPQVKIFLALIMAYIFLWYFS